MSVQGSCRNPNPALMSSLSRNLTRVRTIRVWMMGIVLSAMSACTQAAAQDNLDHPLRDILGFDERIDEQFVLDRVWTDWVDTIGTRIANDARIIAKNQCGTNDPTDRCFMRWFYVEVHIRIMLEVAGARQRIETLQSEVKRLKKAHQDLRRNYNQLVDVLVESDLIRYE